MIEINWLHVLLAALAGGGWCLAWGYRTALGIARGMPASPPRPPREDNVKRWPNFGENDQQRERA